MILVQLDAAVFSQLENGTDTGCQCDQETQGQEPMKTRLLGSAKSHSETIRGQQTRKHCVEQGRVEPRHKPRESRLEAVIGGFERRLEQLERRLAANPVQTTTASKSIEGSASAAHGMSERIEQGIAREAQMKAEIQERLKTEPRDRVWATATEESIRAAAKALAGERGSYSFASLSCLTSLCNVKISLPDITGPQGVMYNLPASVKDIAGFQASPPTKLDDGTYSVEFTIFRKDYPVPGQDETP